MLNYIFLSLSVWFASSFLQTPGNKELVSFRSSDVAIQFKMKNASRFENRNGRVNASIKSANGLLFEVNGIDEKKLMCGKTLTGNDFSLVLIDNNTRQTYTSNAKVKNRTLSVACLKGLKDLLIKVQGWVSYRGKSIYISATLIGQTPAKEYIKTN